MIPTFSTSMQHSSQYRASKDPRWKILEDLYFHNGVWVNGPAQIPKIIHQIWLGSKAPDVLLKNMETVKAANPGYVYKLWTDKDADEYQFANKELFRKARNFGQKSDILRYAILQEFGGIYLDTDFIGVKSFDDLLHLDFFVGVAYDGDPNVFNGLIGTVPNGAVITAANTELKDLQDHDGMAIIKSTGPWYLTEKMFANINKETILALPVSYFYPWPNFHQDRVDSKDVNYYVKPETICIHLWDSRWN